jgi:hypothetical protein
VFQRHCSLPSGQWSNFQLILVLLCVAQDHWALGIPMVWLMDLQVWISRNQDVETQVPFQDHCLYEILTDHSITRQCQQLKTWKHIHQKITVFREVTLWSLVKRYPHSEEHAACFKVKVSSALKMEAPHSSEMLTLFYQTTRCHATEDSNLHVHSCDNLKSHTHLVKSPELI